MPQINRVMVNNVKYNFVTQFYDDFMMRFNCRNTIYDLANGGGKSLLMLLLMQNMIPNCTLDEKQPIEKLFRKGSGNTCIHSLVEWKLDSHCQRDGYRYMTTGFCARRARSAEEREDAKVAIAMSLCQVTEGALPFAFNDPKRVIPAVTIGSGVAHGLVLAWGVTCPVLHGGVFSIPLTSNPLLWVAAYLIGAMVTAVIVSVLKPARPVEAESEDEELKVDFDIEIG